MLICLILFDDVSSRYSTSKNNKRLKKLKKYLFSILYNLETKYHEDKIQTLV